jgi:DNA repair ATPase RecN
MKPHAKKLKITIALEPEVAAKVRAVADYRYGGNFSRVINDILSNKLDEFAYEVANNETEIYDMLDRINEVESQLRTIQTSLAESGIAVSRKLDPSYESSLEEISKAEQEITDIVEESRLHQAEQKPPPVPDSVLPKNQRAKTRNSPNPARKSNETPPLIMKK